MIESDFAPPMTVEKTAPVPQISTDNLKTTISVDAATPQAAYQQIDLSAGANQAPPTEEPPVSSEINSDNRKNEIFNQLLDLRSDSEDFTPDTTKTLINEYYQNGGQRTDLLTNLAGNSPEIQTALAELETQDISTAQEVIEKVANDDTSNILMDETKRNQQGDLEITVVENGQKKQLTVKDYAVIGLFLMADVTLFRGQFMQSLVQSIGNQYATQGLNYFADKLNLKSLPNASREVPLRVVDSLDAFTLKHFFESLSKSRDTNVVYNFLQGMPPTEVQAMLKGERFGSSKNQQLDESTLEELKHVLSADQLRSFGITSSETA